MEQKVFKLTEVICEKDKELEEVHKELNLTQRELRVIEREKQMDKNEAARQMKEKDDEVIVY